MCGICGIVVPEGAPAPGPDLKAVALTMREAMVHRGPDDAGLWLSSDARVALGHRRLSIIDLSSQGRQPMTNEDGTVWAVYNGEIYNFEALADDLRAKGHRFRSHTDTEVLVHLYEEDGPALVHRLRGMFAFAIWDAPRGRLLLARDRLGIKPLYYAEVGGRLLFASEIRALMHSGMISVDLNPAAVAAYLSFGSIAAPDTVIRGIKAMRPGTTLIWERGVMRDETYWALPSGGAPVETAARGPAEAVATVRDALLDAVRAHLVSDRPLGVFLSGGVDSSALVALMRACGHARITSVCIAFPGLPEDEARFARDVARRFETDHAEIPVTAQDMQVAFDRILWAMDQPTMDGVNTYFVSAAARQAGLTVALSGLGGDELFYGYSTFRRVPPLHRWHRWLDAVPGAAAVASAALSLSERQTAKKLGFLVAGPPSVDRTHAALRRLFLPDEVAGLLRPAWRPGGPETLEAQDGVSIPEGLDILGRVAARELLGYCANQLLRDTDAMSMAHTLEVRPPFLDHRVVEAVSRLPSRLKASRPPKALLIEAAGLPPDVAARRKQGFLFPLGHWLTTTLREEAETVLRDPRGPAAEVLDQAAVRGMWQAFLAGRVHWTRPWSLIVLTRWLAMLADDARPRP